MKTETILAAFPHLYVVAHDLVPTRRLSSYAMKHDVERLLGEYCSNEELKEALREPLLSHEGTPNRWGEVNLFFGVKPKFEMFWLMGKPTTRPRGARKSHWEAYQSALAWARQRQASRIAPPPEGSATASGSLGTLQSSLARSSREDD